MTDGFEPVATPAIDAPQAETWPAADPGKVTVSRKALETWMAYSGVGWAMLDDEQRKAVALACLDIAAALGTETPDVRLD